MNSYVNKHAHHRIEWSSECDKAFTEIKKAIDECPLLWFMDDISPIFLQTDASDYGIGAYLYQKVNGVEHPIRFISKAIHNTHSSWDAPMKEGFAIFFALRNGNIC